MLPKYLPLTSSACNTFNTPNMANYSPYELIFCRKPKLVLHLEATPDMKALGMFKDYYSFFK